MPCDKKRKKFL